MRVELNSDDRQILDTLIEEGTLTETAKRLGKHRQTIKNRMVEIRDILGATSTVQAVAYYIEEHRA